MAVVSLPATEYVVADRVVPFVATPTSTRAGADVGERALDLRYQVRSVRSGSTIDLPGDPLALEPVRPARLVLNAVATFVLVLTVGLVLTATVPRFLGYEPVVVISGSMEPAIRVADVVVTTPSDGIDLAEGTVVNFEQDGSSKLHRIAKSTSDGYRTVGDANRTADSELVDPSQITGVGVVVVPFVGLPATWLAAGQWYYVAMLVVVLLAAVYMSRARWASTDNELPRP